MRKRKRMKTISLANIVLSSCIFLTVARLSGFIFKLPLKKPLSPGPLVAVVAESYPTLNQGGNIRLSRVLETMIEVGCEVTLYTREISSPTALNLGKNVIPVVADGLLLSQLSRDLAKYELVFSFFWFWRTAQSPDTLPIPVLVSEMVSRYNIDIRHVTVSDDLQYVRCAKTASNPKEGEVCKTVFDMETQIWENPLIFKFFITEEDMFHAGAISRMQADSAGILPYSRSLGSPSHKVSTMGNFQRHKPCTLAYFGSAHPANVLALLQLFETAGETLLEFHLAAQRSKCTLLIAGDQRWNDILRSANTEYLRDFDITLEVVGFVKDLDALARRATLMLLPVVVGGTGVSTKVINCIEMGMPFMSTFAGNLGFPCDDECEKLFFRESLSEMLTSALEIADDLRLLDKLKKKLKHIMGQNPGHDQLVELVKGYHAENALLRSDTLPNTPAEKGKMTCVSCAADNRDECLEICEVSKGLQRGTEVSIYASLKGTGSEHIFLDGYLKDVLRQDLKINWEVVLATASKDFYDLLMSSLVDVMKAMPDNLRFRVIHMKIDPGLYETWDYLISSHTHGRFLQNWNIDDRKHEAAVRLKYEVLLALPATSLVSSAVIVSHSADISWNHAHGERWFTDKYGFYGLYTLFQKHGERVDSMNLPHNSPMYRRYLHEKYGAFSATWQQKPLRLDISPTCSDFRFWTLALQGGDQFYHVNIPIEVYYVRQDSHNRLPENKIDTCVDQAVSSVFPTLQTGVKLGFDSMSNERVLLSITSEDELTRSKTTILKAVTEILRKGYRLHVLVTEDMMPLSRRIFPRSVLIGSYERLNNPGHFKLGVFLTDSKTTGVSTQLHSSGYFLPHRKTYRAKNVEDFSVLVDSEL